MPFIFDCAGCFHQECDTLEELERVQAAHEKWHHDYPHLEPPERH